MLFKSRTLTTFLRSFRHFAAEGGRLFVGAGGDCQDVDFGAACVRCLAESVDYRLQRARRHSSEGAVQETRVECWAG